MEWSTILEKMLNRKIYGLKMNDMDILNEDFKKKFLFIDNKWENRDLIYAERSLSTP